MKLITTTLVFLTLAWGAVCIAAVPGQKKSAQNTANQGASSSRPDSLTELRSQIEATKNDPEHIRLQLRLSEQLLAAGQKTEAITELRAIINNDVFDPQSYYNAGNALVRLGYSDDAIKAYRKAIEQRRGNYSRALNNLGVVLLREGRWDEAHEALLSALRVENFHYAEASYNLGRLYSARGENDIANREWRRALTIDPGHKAAAQALALGAGQPGIVASASGRSAKNNVSAGAPRTPSTSARPEKNATAPNYSTAKPLTLDPISYDFLQRARELRERGKLEGAVQNFRQVLSRANGYFPPANLELSYTLIALKRNDEALANVLQVANRDGARYPIAYQLVARCYESQGNLELAEEWFAQAASTYKTKNNSFLLDLSRVREHRGNFKGALAALEEYLSAMEQQGLRPNWSDESLAALRRKAGLN